MPTMKRQGTVTERSSPAFRPEDRRWCDGRAGRARCGRPARGRCRAAEAAQVAFTGVERVIAFADVHGAYDDLVKLLKAVGVVDGDLHWSGGRTHLVSTGDLLDRGKDSRKVMDLLMRLQGEAATAGGQLHVTLGNHEAMNLLGHVRDVAPGELEAYAAEEPAGVREKERTEWIARNGADSGAKFDQRFPVGYFGHRVTFAPDGVYGRMAARAACGHHDRRYALHARWPVGGARRAVAARDQSAVPDGADRLSFERGSARGGGARAARGRLRPARDACRGAGCRAPVHRPGAPDPRNRGGAPVRAPPTATR